MRCEGAEEVGLVMVFPLMASWSLRLVTQ